MIQYYSAEKLNTHMTAIRSLTGEIMYLIEGEEKAVLVDTCLGVGHLRRFVETLTEKPHHGDPYAWSCRSCAGSTGV